MALFADWLLRLRGDDFTDSPILAVEKLNSLPQPLQDADKEILVGAVLTMSSSLHLALGMLQGILPQEKSQERLGEVLCPTLGHLSASLQNTLCSFEKSNSRQTAAETATPSFSTPDPATPRVVNGENRHISPGLNRPTTAKGEQTPVMRGPAGRPASSSARPSRPQSARTETERFPSLEDSVTAGHVHIEVGIHRTPATNLVKALQAEMRVQAAINVAIESLEFAEGQLKMVKEVNRLHGGSFDLLQRHFYEGYNRLLFRALELQRRELGLQSARESLISVAPVEQPFQQLNGHKSMRASPRQNSISFQSVSAVQSPAATPRGNEAGPTAYLQRRTPERRNTIQGIKQEDLRASRAKPPLKRRMSLADELAMVGEDSESGYQDETSEMASSASEVESDLESCSNSRPMVGRHDESEEYSTNGESDGEESAVESVEEEEGGEDDDHADKTLHALDTLGGTLDVIRPPAD